MVKKLLLLSILFTALHANNFDQKCVACHAKLPISFDKFYMKYLIMFSSKKYIKEAMFSYLKDPMLNLTVLSKEEIQKMGLMPKLDISDEELKSLIDEYIKRYDVKKKLH